MSERYTGYVIEAGPSDDPYAGIREHCELYSSVHPYYDYEWWWEIIDTARERHPVLETVHDDTLLATTFQAVTDMANFDMVADCKPVAAWTKDVKALWCFSSVGTVRDPVLPSDREIYRQNPWSYGMDRQRVLYTAGLITTMAEQRAEAQGVGKFDATPAELIREFGPHMIYNGTPEQNKALETFLSRQTTIPQDKVFIIDDKPPGKDAVVNTVDQFKTFKLPPDMEWGDLDTLGFVAHVPHLARIMRMYGRNLQRHNERIIQVQPFPISSPAEGWMELAAQELEAILYYSVVTGDAVTHMMPYFYSS